MPVFLCLTLFFGAVLTACGDQAGINADIFSADGCVCSATGGGWNSKTMKVSTITIMVKSANKEKKIKTIKIRVYTDTNRNGREDPGEGGGDLGGSDPNGFDDGAVGTINSFSYNPAIQGPIRYTHETEFTDGTRISGGNAIGL